MPHLAPRTAQTTPKPAPQDFRDALAELVQIGLKVARMVGHSADAETELAEAAAQAGATADASALATSLAEAIEADRAAAAAAGTRQTVTARTTAVAVAYARVSRAIRQTVMLAERRDRGWARGRAADDHATVAKRQPPPSLQDAIMREADSERAYQPAGLRAERLESLDREYGLANRSAEEVIAMICRDLGLDPARMTLRPPVSDAASPRGETGATPFTVAALNQPAHPPQRRPDG